MNTKPFVNSIEQSFMGHGATPHRIAEDLIKQYNNARNVSSDKGVNYEFMHS